MSRTAAADRKVCRQMYYISQYTVGMSLAISVRLDAETLRALAQRVLVEQVGAVDAGRLGDLVGRVTPVQQWGIDDALMTVLGLR